MTQLVTTLGQKKADELGFILPHEHVFVDLRTWDQPGYGEADPADVIQLMRPEIEKIKAWGATALVECSTGGVGLRADIDKAVSEATNFPIVVATGFYREPWIPNWVHEAEEDQLYDYFLKELTHQIGDTGVQAAWIKVSAGDDDITETETKVLRAAARAGEVTNAIIGSHTIRGRVVKDQLRIIEDAGYTAERYIWIHTQNEKDLSFHTEIAGRGAWIEYDGIGGRITDDEYVNLVKMILEADLGNHLMLSHDRGWYDPAKPGGGQPKPYTHIHESFLPKLRAAGVDEATITQLTHTNPFRAYAR